MEIGNNGNTVAWEPDATTGFDAEMLGFYRTYVRLHVRLFPYVWSYLTHVSVDGRAVTRPFGLVHPELGQHPSDQYFLGDWLLSAPVIEEGATSRSVIFPPGKWVNWFDGTVHQGPMTETVDAGLGDLPLYLGEGGIVPLLRPTIDTMAPTTMPDMVDSYATTPGILWARVLPGPDSSFSLFDGATISQTTSGSATTLTVADGSEFTSGFLLEVLALGAAPASVTLDGAPLTSVADLDTLQAATTGYSFDPTQGGSVFVKVGAGTHSIVVTGP
jgi:alpha-D-xyloside xylohydrolase